jgi:hypothetical protein
VGPQPAAAARARPRRGDGPEPALLRPPPYPPRRRDRPVLPGADLDGARGGVRAEGADGRPRGRWDGGEPLRSPSRAGSCIGAWTGSRRWPCRC